MKKFLKVTGVLVIAALGVVAVGAGVYGNKKTIKSYDKVKAFVASEEDKAQKELEKEQDFENIEINDETKIVSTKNISDAFKSGDTKDLKEDEKQILDEAKKVYDSIIKDGMSDYDKEKAIYEWMYDNTFKFDSSNAPETEEDIQTLLGAFKGKVLNERNSAMMFRLLANMADLECMVAHDEEKSSVWNICKLDDKCWYYVYVYSDLESNKYWYFNTVKEENDYMMNAVSDFPEVNGEKYAYSIASATKLDNPDDMIKTMKKAADDKKDFDFSFAIKSDNQKNVDIARYINEGVSYRLSSIGGDTYIPTREIAKGDYVYFRISYHAGQSIDFEKYKIDLEKIDKDLDDRFGSVDQYVE